MIYEITKEIAADLRSKGVPYPIVYGPERAPAAIVDTRVVIERNRRGNDELAAGRARNPNPRMIGVRWLACRARIFASSTLAGPNVSDHERIADLLADKLTGAIHKIVTGRKNLYRITRAHFLTPEELELDGLESWPGVVYDVEFAVDRAVEETNWAGEGKAKSKAGLTVATTLETPTGSGGSGTSLPSVDTEISE